MEHFSTMQSQINSLESQMNQLTQDYAALRSTVFIQENENKSLKHQLDKCGDNCAQHGIKIAALENVNQIATNEIAQLKAALQKLGTKSVASEPSSSEENEEYEDNENKEDDEENDDEEKEDDEENEAIKQMSVLHQRQMEVLRRNALMGQSRSSPQFPPIPKKVYRCVSCHREFFDQINFEKHKLIHVHKTQESNVQALNVSTGNRIEVVGNVNNAKRSYNCHDCSFQGSSSKNLLNHVKETLKVGAAHATDPLHERCFTCDEVQPNFEELMKHRKSVHADKISTCRFFNINPTQNKCKFSAMNCWYTHVIPSAQSNANNVQNVRNNSPQTEYTPMQSVGFHQGQDNPPDPTMGNLTQMFVENCVMNVLQRREFQSYRSPGH